ncbi:MAG TPA: hypothetical protein VLA54_14500 [Acidimicrobiia bacterium]|nr:hypothetical protein [Acidimicrobiia bacterium]
MSELVVVDRSEVRPGKVAELKAAIKELARFVETNEPRPLAYTVYLDDAGTGMTVLQIHPDSASMESHLEVAGSVFARFAELIKLSRMDVYGQPSEKLLDQLRGKIQLLGDATMVVHDFEAGFTRFGSS